jgi:hypothetical protein
LTPVSTVAETLLFYAASPPGKSFDEALAPAAASALTPKPTLKKTDIRLVSPVFCKSGVRPVFDYIYRI